jgi:hypothetical protein
MKVALLILSMFAVSLSAQMYLPPASDPWWHTETGQTFAFVTNLWVEQHPEVYAQRSIPPEQMTMDQIDAALKANTPRLQEAMESIQRVTVRIQAYNTCRANRHWYQIWKKRCRL